MFGISPRRRWRRRSGVEEGGFAGRRPGRVLRLRVEGHGASARVVAVPFRLLAGRRAWPRRRPVRSCWVRRRCGGRVCPCSIRLWRARPTRSAHCWRGRDGIHGAGGRPPEAVAIDAGGAVRDEVFAPLSRASRERRAVELDYASVSGQRRRKIVMEPYGLLNHSGCWYVLGKSRTHREERVFVFRLERIRSVDRPGGSASCCPPTSTCASAGRSDVHRRAGAGRGDVAPAREAPHAAWHRSSSGRDWSGWGTMVVRFRKMSQRLAGGLGTAAGAGGGGAVPPGLAAWVREVARRVSDAHTGMDVSAETPVAIQGP